ncbi:B-box zinc finger protein 20-like [Panicum virgatum]|uniref:B-box zinc finger protein 20-like n=1 Tax=Panicum virgatum TaxID=38727 RepID=UPI0019D69FE9|nr:B-box zinc finger protein 20-like [Panicum virgatum]
MARLFEQQVVHQMKATWTHYEKTGYFFCLEDRALLCRPCDVAVHAAGAHVASHRRFLITGVRVGGGVVVSPATSSGNGSSSAPDSSGNPTTLPDKARPSSSKAPRPASSAPAPSSSTPAGGSRRHAVRPPTTVGASPPSPNLSGATLPPGT